MPDHYKSIDGITCLPCEYPCETCYTNIGCLTCGFSPELRSIPPACSCLEAYYDNGLDCIECAEPCKTCTDIT